MKSLVRLLFFAISLRFGSAQNNAFDEFPPPRRERQLFRASRRLIRKVAKPARWTAARTVELVASSEGILWLGRLLRTSPTAIITGCNVGVFALWQSAILFHEPLLNWMKNHFILSRSGQVRKKHEHTWLSSCFSHCSFDHLLSNTGAFSAFAPPLVKYLGNRTFVYFYGLSCYLSGLFAEFVYERLDVNLIGQATKRLVLANVNLSKAGKAKLASRVPKQNARRQQEATGSLGASGAIMSVVTYALLVFPEHCIRNPLPGFDDSQVGGFEAALALIAVDTLRITNSDAPVGHGAHIGGSLFGILTFVVGYCRSHSAGSIWEASLDILLQLIGGLS